MPKRSTNHLRQCPCSRSVEGSHCRTFFRFLKNSANVLRTRLLEIIHSPASLFFASRLAKGVWRGRQLR